ncbi:claudin-15-like protein [Cricetulus griseus]|uniref:Mitochondrial fission 1 protein n=1 Tax=Cricetulus griseus TaxID=10029 RepID=A0A061I7Q0_CRIGR|nr:claudin-15-like protein [Cricetulus griseus]
MEAVLNELVSVEDLKNFERKFQSEQAAGSVSKSTQFEYAWCLVRSKYNDDIRRGIMLLEELLPKGSKEEQRDYVFYLAVGNYRLKEYEKALKYVRGLLQTEPQNNQAKELERLIDKAMKKDGLVGMAITLLTSLLGQSPQNSSEGATSIPIPGAQAPLGDLHPSMSIAVETFGFFMSALGLLMLGVTLPNSYWRVSTVHGNVITTNTIFENLWYSCATDSLGVSNCWEFPSMLALSGACGMVAISWYAINITTDFFNPLYVGTKYELGPALYLGWSASLLSILGGICLFSTCCCAAKEDPATRARLPYKPSTVVIPRATSDESNISFGKYGKNAYV